jgi:hypothetical protein
MKYLPSRKRNLEDKTAKINLPKNEPYLNSSALSKYVMDDYIVEVECFAIKTELPSSNKSFKR